MSKIDQPTKRSVLIVLHHEQSTPGRIGRMLQARGLELDIRRPCLGDNLPKTMGDHVGAIIFGGPMSANDPDDYIRKEIDWIGVPLREQKPFLGICLGAQMMARHLGERVYTHPEGRAEIGYYPIQATAEGHAFCEATFPDHVYHWHRDGFDLPKGATLLASGEHFPNQACSFGDTAVGLQFHPEVTYATIRRWCVQAEERMGGVGAQPPHLHSAGWNQHDSTINRWTSDFLNRWLASVKD